MKPLFSVVLLLLAVLSLHAQDKSEVFSTSVQTSPSGYVKCMTMETDHHSRLLHPERGSLNDFENWLARRVRAYKEQAAAGYRAPLLTIPIVFHVLTDASGTYDVADALIQAQVDQLNIDYRNLAGSSYTSAADIEIEFCMAILDPSGNPMPTPGINRITTYGAGPFDRATDLEGGTSIKANTQWPPTEYLNIWVCNVTDPSVGGTLLGYAQFPDASGLPGLNPTGGAASTDGVVVAYFTVGSMANPNTALNPAVGRGRTLTHEIGHWMGLRHIWGDAPCGTDDFCADTPDSDAPNYNCDVGHSSCGTTDMVENYMDYSDDACMNTFTADQKTRIRTVFTNSPRRLELPNSAKCALPVPTISFVDPNSTTIFESTACSFQDVVLDLQISMGASDDATVTFNTSGTASGSGLDYEFFPASVVFPAGSTANQQVTVRIYNDGVVEPNEDIVISFTVTTAGDAVATTGDGLDHQIFIEDDDVTPANSGTVILLSEDFEGGGLGVFTTQGASSSDLFQNGNTASATSTYWTTDGTNTSLFAYTNDDACNCDKSNDRLTSPVFSLAGAYTSASLTFDHAFADYDGTESAQVQINTGTGWTTIANLSNTSVATSILTTPWVNDFTLDLSPYIGQANVQIRFRYNDGASWQYGMAIDNIVVSANGVADIQTTDNTALPRDIPLRANEIVHFYDVASGDVMGTIENTSTWDYACTRVEVDRDQTAVGGGAAAFWDNNPANYLMAKTFYVDPANNNPSGTYNITFYFTEAEIAAWEATTGKTRNDLKIVKVQNNPISSVNPANYTSYTIEVVNATLASFGAGWTLSASFSSGFSGFGFGDPVLNPMPVEFLSIEAFPENGDIRLNWVTETEINNDYFIIERSPNGIEFEEIYRLDGAGNSNEEIAYSILDKNPLQTFNYYRVTTVDFDGTKEQSKVVVVDLSNWKPAEIRVAPNPVKVGLNVTYTTPHSGPIRFEIYDVLGQQISYNQALEVVEGENEIYLNVSDFASGVYFIHIAQGPKIYSKRFVKQ